MARGGISHLALTVTDLNRSASFYEKVLGFMGYARSTSRKRRSN
jgi:catechol 2,3-dioxygenase-like lactoylglutathione lyase family enzyme